MPFASELTAGAVHLTPRRSTPTPSVAAFHRPCHRPWARSCPRRTRTSSSRLCEGSDLLASVLVLALLLSGWDRARVSHTGHFSSGNHCMETHRRLRGLPVLRLSRQRGAAASVTTASPEDAGTDFSTDPDILHPEKGNVYSCGMMSTGS